MSCQFFCPVVVRATSCFQFKNEDDNIIPQRSEQPIPFNNIHSNYYQSYVYNSYDSEEDDYFSEDDNSFDNLF